MTPTYSICHASARVPDGWEASYLSWMDRATRPDRVEYVLAVHDRDWPTVLGTGWPGPVFSGSCVKLRQSGRYCSVDNWNAAAAASTGDIIILNADDFRPPHGWDDLLLRAIGKQHPLIEEFAVHVSTGGTRDDELMALPILSRARYERLEYALYPEYESMFSDDDFGAHARHDGCVIDARELTFEHLHPAFGKAAEDDVYRHQNRREAYELGRLVFERRQKEGFTK